MRESEYQRKIYTKLEKLFPGCMIIKNDPQSLQGIPDFLILWKGYWAALEVKTSPKAEIQPNQEIYVDNMNSMSFAAFIYPENEEEVLCDLQHAFGCS